MSRRLLGSVVGPIGFLLVAGLVFAGLGWVTVAAMRVEDSQRESARRADREKELRIALWRLDARMLPALGVEDTRPFYEFKTFSTDDPITIYGPASAALLAGDLPDWMQLHFQLDPETNWESPQVLDRSTRLALLRNWPGLPLRNATKHREEHLTALALKFPARSTGDLFASRDRAIPVISPPSTPLSINGGFGDSDGLGIQDAEPQGVRKEVPPPTVENLPKPAPVSAPMIPPADKTGAEARAKEPAGTLAKADEPADAKKRYAAADPRPNAEPENYSVKGEDKKLRADQNRANSFDARQTVLGIALSDVARFKYQLVPSNSAMQNGIAQKKLADQTAGEKAKMMDDNSTPGRELALGVPQFRSDSFGFLRLMEEARTRELERKQLDNLHRGALKKDADRKEEATKDAAKGAMAFGKPSGGGLGSGGPSAPPPPGLPAAGGSGPPRVMAPGGPPAAGAAPGFAGRDGVPPVPVPPTPDPAPPAMLQPVELPVIEDAVAPAVAVHLGTLRPQWLTAPDGTPLLVLVRTARVENRKTVYQGVVLDWVKLQALLRDEVKDLFPDAKIEPVKETTAESREQSMTALPVRLDPGAESELPPAGWTPLRLGLALAWAAALIAFAAVGLTGWKLVDLAERRIRFVSAVTHELRTPLTSLRLYLDLLLSGMVQDEDKRREYLSTLNVESDRLHRLIDNVLDFAKLERSRKGRDLQPVKAADLLDSIRLTWMDRVAADGKELVTESALPENLGITTDGSLVQQIVGNLIDNARKYTREATDARISLSANVEGSKLVFEVRDRGCGVPAREQKTIFRPFRRGETADTKAGGAGLGLALSKEWAEVLGGKLLHRTPVDGVGSTFRLELPIKS